jgi:glycine/D-amino acid oxidase-like deaminating enzyme
VPALHRMMTQRFPQLARVRVTHAWTGNVAFTFDFLPHMGRHDGMHYMLGCNGSGVAMMTYLGTRTARKILGGANRVSALDQRDFPTVLLYDGFCPSSAATIAFATGWIDGWRERPPDKF